MANFEAFVLEYTLCELTMQQNNLFSSDTTKSSYRLGGHPLIFQDFPLVLKTFDAYKKFNMLCNYRFHHKNPEPTFL